MNRRHRFSFKTGSNPPTFFAAPDCPCRPLRAPSRSLYAPPEASVGRGAWRAGDLVGFEPGDLRDALQGIVFSPLPELQPSELRLASREYSVYIRRSIHTLGVDMINEVAAPVVENTLTAPWTQEEVDLLNAFQSNPENKPYRCSTEGCSHPAGVVSIAGWECPECHAVGMEALARHAFVMKIKETTVPWVKIADAPETTD